MVKDLVSNQNFGFIMADVCVSVCVCVVAKSEQACAHLRKQFTPVWLEVWCLALSSLGASACLLPMLCYSLDALMLFLCASPFSLHVRSVITTLKLVVSAMFVNKRAEKCEAFFMKAFFLG